MAHVTLEELYYVCDCCYGFPCTEECDTCAAWCEGELDPYDGCKHQETRTRFIESGDFKDFVDEIRGMK